jgi:hypothetical protein
MLSATHARRAATALVTKFGEVAIAAAMLRAQEHQARGELIEMANWRRIAEAAVRRLHVH